MLIALLLVVAGVFAFMVSASDGAGAGCAVVGIILVLIGIVGFLATITGIA